MRASRLSRAPSPAQGGTAAYALTHSGGGGNVGWSSERGSFLRRGGWEDDGGGAAGVSSSSPTHTGLDAAFRNVEELERSLDAKGGAK